MTIGLPDAVTHALHGAISGLPILIHRRPISVRSDSPYSFKCVIEAQLVKYLKGGIPLGTDNTPVKLINNGGEAMISALIII